MKIDKRLLFNRIKLAIGVRTDAELAKFLGITPQTLANYIIRNSVDWDNLLSKCELINIDFLLTGHGEMLRSNTINQSLIGDNNKNNLLAGGGIYNHQQEIDELKKQLVEKDKTINNLIRQQEKLINKLTTIN